MSRRRLALGTRLMVTPYPSLHAHWLCSRHDSHSSCPTDLPSPSTGTPCGTHLRPAHNRRSLRVAIDGYPAPSICTLTSTTTPRPSGARPCRAPWTQNRPSSSTLQDTRHGKARHRLSPSPSTHAVNKELCVVPSRASTHQRPGNLLIFQRKVRVSAMGSSRFYFCRTEG